MKINAPGVGAAGTRYRGLQRGELFALLPEPAGVDAALERAGLTHVVEPDASWSQDFARVVSDTLQALGRRWGEPEVVVLPHSPQQQSWKERLKTSLVGKRAANPLNPEHLSPLEALLNAASAGEPLERAMVRFTSQVLVWTSDGRPILWVWMSEEVAAAWSDVVAEAAYGLPCVELSVDWDAVLPAHLALSKELPRARIHRGESASWTNGEEVLGFDAGLGVVPPVVHIPPDSEWLTVAPAWATELRPMIASDFAALGALVVDRPGARVSYQKSTLSAAPLKA